jgi:hypothetical protein
MEIVVTLVAEIPDGDLSVKSLEQVCSTAGREFPGAFWQAAVRAVEAAALAQHPPGRLTVKSWEARTLWTAAGPVIFRRRRFASPAEARSFLLFDLRVGLAPGQRTTAAADRLFAETAAEVPYAPAARCFARVWGDGPSPMLVWTATQRVGGLRRREAEALRRAIFVDGELPGAEKPEPAFVGVEADSTFLPAWREQGTSHEVYLGVSYTGKEERRGRRRLAGKVLCASLDGAGRFGEELFARVQAAHNVCAAECGVFLSDGAPSLRAIQEEHFPLLARQADWAHVTRRVAEAYGRRHAGRAGRILRPLRLGRWRTASAALRREARRCRERAAELTEAAEYLERLGEDLYAVRRLRERFPAVPEHLEGSGAVERQIGVTVTQRMKRRGMSWTKRGAECLLAVRQDLLVRLSA